MKKVLSTVLLLLAQSQIASARYPRPWYGPKGDPAAYRIYYQLVQKSHPFRGTVRILGIVKNLSNVPYRSGVQARLYEVDPSGRSRMVAQRRFSGMGPGQQVTVSFQREWFSKWTFPPSYRLVVALNPDHPDQNASNNVHARSGQGAHQLFEPLRIAPIPRIGPSRLRPIPMRIIRRR